MFLLNGNSYPSYAKHFELGGKIDLSQTIPGLELGSKWTKEITDLASFRFHHWYSKLSTKTTSWATGKNSRRFQMRLALSGDSDETQSEGDSNRQADQGAGGPGIGSGR